MPELVHHLEVRDEDVRYEGGNRCGLRGLRLPHLAGVKIEALEALLVVAIEVTVELVHLHERMVENDR